MFSGDFIKQWLIRIDWVSVCVYVDWEEACVCFPPDTDIWTDCPLSLINFAGIFSFLFLLKHLIL